MNLPDTLTGTQAALIRYAKVNELPVLIDGPHRATGKSTLCESLRNQGVDAYEAWELEAPANCGGKEMNRDKACFVTVLLETPITQEDRRTETPG